MGKWTIEMCYGLNVSVEGVEAETREEAEKIARQMVDENIEEYADMNGLEFEMTTYVSED